MAWTVDGLSYDKRYKLDLQTTNLDANQTDFTNTITFTNDSNMADANADGFDIRFTASDGSTLLKYEREYWSGGGGSNVTTVLFVKSDISTAGTTIYCYWRSTDTADGADETNAWDANYTLVYHMNDLTTSTVNDSSATGANGTKTSANNPIQSTGKLGYGQTFDGSDDEIATGKTHGQLMTNAAGTISCWVKPTGTAPTISNSYAGDNVVGNSASNRFAGLHRGIISGADRIWAYNWDGTEDRVGLAYTVDVWNHIAWVHGGGNLYGYLNGSGSSTASGNTTTTVNFFYIGSADTAQFFEGDIDEVRISTVARSAAWLKFEYYNMNEADNEWTRTAEGVAQPEGIARLLNLLGVGI